MQGFDPATSDFWVTISMAIVCGAVIGMERQLRGKPAGVRTSILICLATAVFTRLGSLSLGDNADPTRVLSQVVTGVGFLGAGVMMARQGVVTGVTTASVIWLLAAIGAAIGLGFESGAAALTAVTLGVLLGVEVSEKSVRWLTRGAHRRGNGPPADDDDVSDEDDELDE